jgi:hypothetical protein
MVNVKFMVLW